MSSISSTTGGLINFSGLASGINTNQIIQGLTQINQQQITNLTNQQNAVKTQQSAFTDIQTKLTSLQSAVQQLTSTVNGALGGHTATTSDSTALSAAADSTAQVGTYSVTVNSLARAEQIASGGVASVNSTIQQGTLQLQVGSGATTSITIDSTNDTLQGLANAINNAGGDVQASIVNDGSANPYRLLLTSTKTGAANTINITNNLTSGSGASLSFSQTIQSASDAQITLGSGSGALTFNSGSNTISNAIAGVTLNLQKASSTTPLTLTIANDTATAGNAIQGFATAYNAVIDDISQNSTYDATTKKAGVLLGNTNVQQLQNDLQNAISTIVPGVNSNASSLASIGITFDSSGDLQVDQTKLNQALSGQLPGVGANDIERLFALTGQSSSPGVSFILGSSKTQASGTTPYQVNITQAATQASVTAGTALASTVNITSSNNAFTIKVNGITSSPIDIPIGSYTPAQLAASVQTAINGNAQLGTSQVAVSLNGSNQLQISSTAYGTGSEIAFAGGSALGASSPLGLTGAEAASGQNVQGNFVINGKTEAATGFGQILSGNSGNANTDGLQLNVTLDPSQVGAGKQSTLSVTAGLATQLNTVLNKYLDPATGQLKTINDQFQANITTIGNQITTQNTALQTQENSLLSQFNQMETTISQLQSTGQILSALLANPTSSTSSSSTPSSSSSPTKL